MDLSDKAFLILADGTVFEGKAMGARGRTIGETVFTTGMTGYIETLTDPSYFGQIVTQTFPLIGNYGVIPEDFESKKSYVKGYIVREICDKPSNFRCGGDLDSFLKKQGIVGIYGIDTRKLTKKLREAGVMNGMILSGIENETTGTMSMEQRGDFLMKNKISSKKKKIIFDKDAIMDKENYELIKEEESLNDSILNSDRKIINVINSDNFKERLKEFMNKN